jgi:tetratricopeptide (TPR) repeat protein
MPTYDAFISYSHAKDKALAAALQTVKQKLGKPWYRRRALRVFRDDTSLAASPQLWPAIEVALSQSRYLVLLASPEAAASPWVGKEVAYWIDRKGVDTVLIALTEGMLVWDEEARDFRWSEDSPLPPVLKGRFSSEPKWVDLCEFREKVNPRDRRFIERGADFAAAIHGVPKEDLLSQELRQQRNALSLAWSAVGLLLVLFGVAAWKWNDAAAQRDRAEAALVQANRNFTAATNVGSGVIENVRELISAGTMSSKVAEPLLELTRKTILQLDDETPNDKLATMQWRLLNTLSFAYIDVPGQGEHAVDLAQKMRVLAEQLAAISPGNDDYRQLPITSQIRIGDALEALGRFDEALKQYGEGRARMVERVANDPSDGDRKRMLVYIQQRIGDTLRKKGEFATALREFETNLAMVKELAGHAQPKPDWIRGLALAHQRMGDIHRDLADPERALEQFKAYRDAAKRLVGMEKPNVPNLTWRLDLAIGHQRIGDILLEQRQYAGALDEYAIYRKAAEEAVQRDPEQGEWQRFLANSRLKIGDALFAQGAAAEAFSEFAAAEKAYRDLAARDRRPRSQRNLAVAHQRLGLARLAMKDSAGALAEFQTCVSLPVDEAARDAQITMPSLVHYDCRDRAAQIGSSAPQ